MVAFEESHYENMRRGKHCDCAFCQSGIKGINIDPIGSGAGIDKDGAVALRAAILAGPMAWTAASVAFVKNAGVKLFEGMKTKAEPGKEYDLASFTAGLMNGYINAIKMVDGIERIEQGIPFDEPRPIPDKIRKFLDEKIAAGGVYRPEKKEEDRPLRRRSTEYSIWRLEASGRWSKLATSEDLNEAIERLDKERGQSPGALVELRKTVTVTRVLPT